MPGALKLVIVDDLTMVSAGVCAAMMTSDTDGEVTAPDLALAVLSTLPLSRSACVVVYAPVQMIDAAGSNPPTGNAGQLTLAILLSDTVIAVVSVTLPVFVTL